MIMEELLTVDEAADRLGTSPRFPRRLITERRIRFVRVGRHVRIPASALGGLHRCEHRRANGARIVSRGRPFGTLRQLPSGRYQVRYLGPDGLRRAAPRTFATRADARRWLSLVEGEIARGTWEDRSSEGEPLVDYGARWIAERPGLSERSIELYSGLLRLHIGPTLGPKGIRKITPADVRSWRQGLLDAGVGPSTVSKAYRLLRAILNTAFDDELIRRNPCRIKGAGVEHPAERPVLALEQVMVLADAIDPRYRLLVLLAVFASLRWGELMGLRKTDFDLVDGLVRVERSVVLIGAEQVVKRPKTAAGVRTVAFPRWLLPLVEAHFRDYSDLSRMERCSSVRTGRRRLGRTSPRSGGGRSPRPASPDCTFTTSGTRGTTSPRCQVPARAS